ncbi:hypothetical protein INTERNEXUS_27 [Bacillus phage vB_BspM_Internexus]|nr:hypothetical protein INTERNEXUS_27 [Bacillus phage vB_BspM_Internexus]
MDNQHPSVFNSFKDEGSTTIETTLTDRCDNAS